MKKNINIINATIKDPETLYEPFNNTRLSKELGSYLYNDSLQFSPQEEIEIHINTQFTLDEKEQAKLIDMIREFFGLNIRETLNYYRYSRIKKIVLFLIGIILIWVAHLTAELNDFLFSEVFLITGWFAIWEIFDNFSFIETKKRFKLKYLKKLVSCKIKINTIKE